jgi:hypothetical protein
VSTLNRLSGEARPHSGLCVPDFGLKVHRKLVRTDRGSFGDQRLNEEPDALADFDSWRLEFFHDAVPSGPGWTSLGPPSMKDFAPLRKATHHEIQCFFANTFGVSNDSTLRISGKVSWE